MRDEFLPLMQAAAYLGVSRMKLSRMVRAGELEYVTSPLDKRVKLFRRELLDQLKGAPRPWHAPGPTNVVSSES